jgi:phage gp36-like protein
MSWTTITTASVLTTISQAELSKYQTTSTGSMYNSGSLLQEIINDTIGEVRGFIIGCQRNQLDTNANLIPSSCVNHAKNLIVYRLMSRVAGKITDINESRKLEYDKALEFLEKVSEGKIGIEPTDNPLSPSGQYYPFYGNSVEPVKY